MENRFGAPASGTPEERSARREFELLLLLSGSRKGAVQLWKWERRQRIYANAQQAAGRPATEAKGSRGAAERQAGGESKPETAAQAARRHRSEHRLREKHLARKIWAAVRVRKHFSRWCERARAAVAKRPAPLSSGGQHPLRHRRGGTSIKGSWPGVSGGGAPRGKNSGFFSLLRAFFTRGGVAARPAQATLHVSALCGAS
jgi:hypothetical protein